MILEEVKKVETSIRRASDSSRQRVLWIVFAVIVIAIGLDALLLGGVLAVNEFTGVSIWEVALATGSIFVIVGAGIALRVL